jgi:hypothetical protein
MQVAGIGGQALVQQRGRQRHDRLHPEHRHRFAVISPPGTLGLKKLRLEMMSQVAESMVYLGYQ